MPSEMLFYAFQFFEIDYYSVFVMGHGVIESPFPIPIAVPNISLTYGAGLRAYIWYLFL